MKSLIFICLAFLASSPAYSQILSFSWRDIRGDLQSIDFDIPYEMLRAGMLNGRDRVQLSEVLQDSYQQARVYADSISTTLNPVLVRGNGRGFGFETPADPGLAKDVKRNFMRGITSLHSQSYFTFDEFADGFRPDYLAIVADNQDLFFLIAQAVIAKFGVDSPDELIDQMLSFLQQIPYDDMSRDDFPMAVPIRMLVERRGDCESKQVMLVGVLSIIFPDRQFAFVQIPDQNHILAAISLDRGLESRVFNDGRSYVLMDGTGPVSQPFGSVFQYHRDAEKKGWIAL